jgi:hypothetical protein
MDRKAALQVIQQLDDASLKILAEIVKKKGPAVAAQKLKANKGMIMMMI